MRVRDREADLGAIQRLRQLYGEFLSARRAWNLHIRSHALTALDERGLDLLDRAAATEGEMEAILMKIAQERKLEPDEINSLGLVRQAYQKLRESIRNFEPLGWGHGDHPHYVALKQGTALMVNLLSRGETRAVPDDQFRKIADHSHEARWNELDEDEYAS